MFFQSEYCIFNGIDLWVDYGLKIRYVDTDPKINFGYKQSISEEKFNGNFPVVYKVNADTIDDTQITFVREDKYGNPLPMDLQFRQQLAEILFINEYAPITFDESDGGITYYVLFNKGERWDNGCELGYITCTMHFMTPYGYTNKMLNFVTSYNSRTFKIENKSNCIQEISPYIEIESLSDTIQTIQIKNLSTNTITEFKDVSAREKIRMFNDIKWVDGDKGFLYKNFNRKFISLHRGVNNFEVIGTCQVTVKNMFPIAT